jgi:hypothetical protein
MHTVSTRIALWLIVVFALGAIGAVLVAAAERGPWLDEFATYYFADPTVPLSEAFRDRWLFDPPPPLFDLIARQFTVFGQGLMIRRLVNLIPLSFTLAWLASAWTVAPGHRRFLAIYAVLVMSSTFFIGYFPEYRSYFFQYGCEVVFFGAAYIGFVDQRRTPDWFLLVCIPFLICLHQITAIFFLVMIGVLILFDLRQRRFVRAIYASLLTLASTALVLIFTWSQFHRTKIFDFLTWIEPRSPKWSLDHLLGLRWYVVAAIGMLILAAHWLPALRLVLTRLKLPSQSSLNFCGLTAIAMALGTTVILIINAFIPLMVDRYFSILDAAANCLLAVLLQDLLFSHAVTFGLFILGSGLYFGINAVKVATEKRWDRAAETIAQTAKNCPGTRTYVVAQFAPEQIGYDYYAKLLHLNLIPVAERAKTDRTPEDSCPTLVWLAHFLAGESDWIYRNTDLLTVIEREGRFSLSAAESSRATAAYTDPGILLTIAPPP